MAVKRADRMALLFGGVGASAYGRHCQAEQARDIFADRQ
jgi:hypothetical protein